MRRVKQVMKSQICTQKSKYIFCVLTTIFFVVTFLHCNELFEYFPKFKERIAYVQLGDLPTPITKLENIGALFNHPNLYMKRDDLSGAIINGTRIFGGNKVRKLEYLLADAQRVHARGVLTAGCAGSNHALATTVYAKLLGLEAHIILAPQINSAIVQRNLLLDKYYGADIMCVLNRTQRCEQFVNFIREYSDVYAIPVGGSVPLGCIGYVNAAFELKKQIEQKIVPEPDDIYVAVGSGGTVAGLILGVRAAGIKSKIHAIAVDDDPFQTIVGNLVQQTTKLLHDIDNTFPLFTWTPADFIITTDFVGVGYGAITPEACEAIKIAKQYERIMFEGTYTAKAFAGFLHDLSNGLLKNRTVLFWNTFSIGNFDELTKSVDYKSLPAAVHKYFESKQ